MPRCHRDISANGLHGISPPLFSVPVSLDCFAIRVSSFKINPTSRLAGLLKESKREANQTPLKVKDNAQLGIASYRKFADYRERLKHERGLAPLPKMREMQRRIRLRSLVKVNHERKPDRFISVTGISESIK